MIFKKIFFYIEKKANFLLIIILICTTKVQSEDFFKSYYGSLLSGQIAKYNNDNQKAAEFFSIASEKNPKNYNIFESKLMSLILSGNVKKAVEELEKNNQITTNSKIVKLLKFVHFLNSEKYNEAIDYLNKNEDLLISDKIKPIIQSWLSTDLKTSIRYINDFSNKSSGKMLSEIYKSHLAIMYVFYNEPKEAIKAFEKLLDINKGDKIRSLYFYSNLIKNNQLDSILLNSFSKEIPDHSFNIYINKNTFGDFTIKKRKDGLSESFFNIAEILYGQGMYESSIAYCYLSLYLNDTNYINHYLVAQNYQNLGKRDLAITSLRKIPLNNYLGWNSHLKISDLESNVNNFNEAEKIILELDAFSPSRLDIFYKLGELYHNSKKYQEAVYAFDKAISFLEKPEKKDWYLYYSRGMAYERSRNWKKAEKDFLMALDLSPNQPLVLNYLGYSWIDFGINLDKAEKFILKAIELKPNDGFFVDSLGWAYYRKGEYSEAITELEKAVSLVPNDPIINDHLGDALYRAGYKSEAIYQWNRALLYNPDKELKAIIKLKLEKGL